MPPNQQNLTLDASQMVAELEKVRQAFAAHNTSVGQVADVYVKITQETKGVKREFELVEESGRKVEGQLKKTAQGYDALVKKVSGATETIKAFRAAQLAQAAVQTEQFLKTQNVPTTNVPIGLQSQLRTAQDQLTKALLGDLQGGKQAAEDIYSTLLSGTVKAEVGIRGKIQQALISVLRTAERIREVQSNIANPKQLPPNVPSGQLGQFRQNIEQAFPVPPKASIQSIYAYQNALNALTNQAAKGKITLQEFQKLFQDVRKDPTANFAGANQEMQKAQTSIQRVIAAYKGMDNAAEAAKRKAEETGRSLFISFDQFIRILEIQIVHRAFGNLITGMQNAIGQAADLQIRISEIRTIAQSSGISFGQFQGQIRALSEEFNQPQVKVAEALYQGFSNQVIKSASDMDVLREALRLARIGVTDAGTAMNLLSSVITAYSLNSSEAEQATNQLFKAIEIGRFRAEDVANSLGRITVVAGQLGVTFPEVAGLLANLTRAGISSSEAMTQISGIFQAILKPSSEMTKVFRQWGVDSGLAAFQTFGFVGVLQRLYVESQRAGSELSHLIPNVRAYRAIIGATQGGGTAQLQTDIDTIQNAQQAGDEATRIITESAGARFRQEMVKIQNFFINDFANAFIETSEEITKSFGGFSGIVTSIGKAIVDLVKIGTDLISIFTKIAGAGDLLGINIGSLIKLYIAFKTVTLAWSAAAAISATVTQFVGDAKLQASVAQAAQTVSTVAGTAATATQTAAELAAAAATAAHTAGLSPLIAGMSAAGAAATVQTAAVTSVTYATIAATVATNALKVAMAAIPFLLVVGVIGYLVGAFDPLIERLNGTKKALEEIEGLERRLTEKLRDERTQRNREVQNETNQFNQSLDSRSRRMNLVLAALRQFSQKYVEEQRAAVAKSTEQLHEATRVAQDDMNKQLENTRRILSESKAQVRQSFQRETGFADRDASHTFQTLLKAASAVPTVQSGLHPFTFEQASIHDYQEQGAAVAFMRQRQLIQQRLNQLQEEAAEAVRRNDAEGIQSARRKFEEIRRLTDQQFELETARSQHVAQEQAAAIARMTGAAVAAPYNINLAEQQRRQLAVTAQERAAEEQYRRQQLVTQAEAQRRVNQQIAQQTRLNDAIKAVQALSLTDREGQVRPEYQREGGVNLFRQRFTQAQREAEAAAAAAGIDQTRQFELHQAFGRQRVELERQLEREITDNKIRELQRSYSEQQRLLREQHQEVRRLESEANDQRREALREIPARMRTMLEAMNREIPSAFAISQLDPAQVTRRNQLVEIRDTYTTQQQAATRAFNEYDMARGTNQETAALQNLQRVLAELSTTYRNFFRAIGARQAEGQGGLTGTAVAAQAAIARGGTPVETMGRQLEQSAARLEEARIRLEALRTSSRDIETQIARLPAGLTAASQGLGGFGLIAQAQLTPIRNMTEALSDLARTLERIANRPGALINLPQAQRPRFVEPEGPNALGGLLGNVFSNRGSDDMLITARRGEFIVNPESSRRFYSQLVAINANRLPHFAEGGQVSNTYGDVTINVQGSSSPEVTARAVYMKLLRERRRGNT